MSSVPGSAKNAVDTAQRHAAPWVEGLARAGYAAKGMLYLMVGGLAVQAAVGWGGQTDGSKGALSTLTNEGPIGTVLLWAIAIGLVGYTLWTALRAILDPENEGNDAKGIIKRLGFMISAVIHGVLAIWIFTYLFGNSSGSSNGDGAEDWVASALEWHLAGRIAVALVGAGIIAFGVHQLIKAWKIDLSDQLAMGKMSPEMRKATVYTGRAGLAARGIVFAMMGWFCIQAAWQYNSEDAGGLGDAMKTLGDLGPWVLGFVAAGLAAYGIFMFIKARYRRIDPS